MKTYRLKDVFGPFDRGAEFIDGKDGLLISIDNPSVMAKIPTDLLDKVSDGGYWKPKIGNTYYYIDASNHAVSDVFNPIISILDHDRISIGNCFKTKEEAQAMVDWLKAKQRLIESGARFMNGVGVDDEDVAYYGVAFDKIRSKLHTIKCYNVGDDVFDKRLYFLTEDAAEESIRDYRSDWLTYLGVGEEDDDQD